MTLFKNRKQAGEELSNYILGKTRVDTVVVPFPEASEVAKEVADRHNAEIDLRLSDFISSPNSPYADIGAVADDGTIWIEDNLRNELKVTAGYIENTAQIKSNQMQNMQKRLRQREIDLRGENVLIVSDGISSGFREAAIAGSLLKNGSEEIYVAAPFRSRKMMADIESVVDEVFSIIELPFLSCSDAGYDENLKEDDKNYRSQLTA